MFTFDRISAEEAERIGIVNQVVPAQDLMDEARKMAAKIAENIPDTISTMKSLINQSMSVDLETGLSLEASQHKGGPITPTEEGKRRIRSFMERRGQ